MPATCALRSCNIRCRKQGLREKRHHFKVPSDPDLLKQWRSLTSTSNLKSTDFLCQLHFDPTNIIKENVYTINGQEVRTPRGKWTLKPGTLPSLLLDDSDAKPSSHSNKRPKPQSNSSRATQTTSSLDNEGLVNKQTGLAVDRYDAVPVADSSWRWVHFQDHEETWQCVELVAGTGGFAEIRKLVLVKPSENNVNYFVYGQEYRGCYLNNSYSSLKELQDLLVGFHNLVVCTGPKGPTSFRGRVNVDSPGSTMSNLSKCHILTKHLDRWCNECRHFQKYVQPTPKKTRQLI